VVDWQQSRPAEGQEYSGILDETAREIWYLCRQ
jgi:hypothetical protein